MVSIEEPGHEANCDHATATPRMRGCKLRLHIGTADHWRHAAEHETGYGARLHAYRYTSCRRLRRPPTDTVLLSLCSYPTRMHTTVVGWNVDSRTFR